MRRRSVLIGAGAFAFCPKNAVAQQPSSSRRLGWLLTQAQSDPQAIAATKIAEAALAAKGWSVGRNLDIDYKFGLLGAERVRSAAAEVLSRNPDAVLTVGSLVTSTAMSLTRTVPIVFSHVPDPLIAGFVTSLSRPSGNATGFTQMDFSISAKWLELLQQLVPGLKDAGVIVDQATPSSKPQLDFIEAAGRKLGITVHAINIKDEVDVERNIGAFAGPRRGVILTPSGPANFHRQKIIAEISKQRLPAVYPYGHFAVAGGLLSYGPEFWGQAGPAAEYVARIFAGEKPADLPVQAPTRYELIFNLKTAKGLGIEVPAMLLARADGVIE